MKHYQLSVKSIVLLALISLFLLSVFTFWIFSVKPFSQDISQKENTYEPANIFTVRGSSLLPRIVPGAELKLVKTSQYRREDIVMIEWIGSDTPLAKIVKVLPGDHWLIDEGGKIIVNGEILKNSQGQPYQINTTLLKLYAKDYPIIPPETYLLMGDQANVNTLDSSSFGLVPKSQIIGRLDEIKK